MKSFKEYLQEKIEVPEIDEKTANDDKELENYVKKYKGLTVILKGKKFKVGDMIYVPGDLDVGISGGDGVFVGPTSKNSYIYQNLDNDEFEEVNAI